MLIFTRRLALAAAVTLTSISGALAEEANYSANLDASAETPPNASKGDGQGRREIRHIRPRP